MIAGIGSEQVVGLVSWVRSGHALGTVLRGNSAQIQLLTIILTYALNVLAVAALFFIAWCLRSIPAGNAGSGSQSVFETAQLVLSVSAFLEKTVERNEEGILHWQG